MNVAVLLSGGVDSAVVVHRLKEQGIDPTLFYIRIGMDNDEGDCSAEEDIEMCTYIARKYGHRYESHAYHRQKAFPRKKLHSQIYKYKPLSNECRNREIRYDSV